MTAAELRDLLDTGLRSGSIISSEPMFLLRATDLLSAASVDHWADLLERLDSPAGSTLVVEARRSAVAMKRWTKRSFHGRE